MRWFYHTFADLNKILVALFCLLYICEPVLAQDSADSTRKKITFAIRGKVAAFFIVEDLFFRTGTIGGEVTFNNKHSVGIDATYFRWRTETDDDRDVAMYEFYEKRTYTYVDYKYRFLTFKDFDFYINTYDKIGSYKTWYKAQDYLMVGWTDFLKSTIDGRFNECGLGVGVKNYTEGNLLGIDCSANIKLRFINNNYYEYVYPDAYLEYKHVKFYKPGFYMRLNLFYRF